MRAASEIRNAKKTLEASIKKKGTARKRNQGGKKGTNNRSRNTNTGVRKRKTKQISRDLLAAVICAPKRRVLPEKGAAALQHRRPSKCSLLVQQPNQIGLFDED